MPRQLSDAEKAAVHHRHTYHAPADDGVKQAHEAIREIMERAELEVLALLPGPSRSACLFSTKMDEARMWANAALATQDGVKTATPAQVAKVGC